MKMRAARALTVVKSVRDVDVEEESAVGVNSDPCLLRLVQEDLEAEEEDQSVEATTPKTLTTTSPEDTHTLGRAPLKYCQSEAEAEDHDTEDPPASRLSDTLTDGEDLN